MIKKKKKEKEKKKKEEEEEEDKKVTIVSFVSYIPTSLERKTNHKRC